MSSSALEVMMKQEHFQKKLAKWIVEFNPVMLSWTEQLFKRVILRRPHTDDMMQMLDDLSIKPPDRNFDLEFKWRKL